MNFVLENKIGKNKIEKVERENAKCGKEFACLQVEHVQIIARKFSNLPTDLHTKAVVNRTS